MLWPGMRFVFVKKLLLSVVLVLETVLIKKMIFLTEANVESISKEFLGVRISSFVFEYFAQLSKEKGMSLYFQLKQSYQISPWLVLERIMFSFRN